jgi:poly [ADP-ribose] polymerase
MNEKYHADYYANLLPPGKHSTKGLGKAEPISGKYIDDGKVYVPCGKCAPTNIPNVIHF